MPLAPLAVYTRCQGHWVESGAVIWPYEIVSAMALSPFRLPTKGNGEKMIQVNLEHDNPTVSHDWIVLQSAYLQMCEEQIEEHTFLGYQERPDRDRFLQLQPVGEIGLHEVASWETWIPGYDDPYSVPGVLLKKPDPSPEARPLAIDGARMWIKVHTHNGEMYYGGDQAVLAFKEWQRQQAQAQMDDRVVGGPKRLLGVLL